MASAGLREEGFQVQELEMGDDGAVWIRIKLAAYGHPRYLPTRVLREARSGTDLAYGATRLEHCRASQARGLFKFQPTFPNRCTAAPRFRTGAGGFKIEGSV
eukprot:2302015-Rhodomonas_salina.1